MSNGGEHKPSAQPEAGPDVGPLVHVEIGTEHGIWMPQKIAIDAAFEAASQLFPEAELTALKVLDPKSGTLAERAHLLALALLSENTSIDFLDLARELEYTPYKLLQATEAGYVLIEEKEQTHFEILQAKYGWFMLGKPSERGQTDDENNKPALSDSEQSLFNKARAGDIKSAYQLETKYKTVIDEIIEDLNPRVPEDDAYKIAVKALRELLHSFDLSSPESFTETVKTAVILKLAEFYLISNSASTTSMPAYLMELTEFGEQLSDAAETVRTSIDKSTADTIIRGALGYLSSQLDKESSQIAGGIPMSNIPRLTIRREVDGIYEKTLRSHIFNSAVMKESDWYDFDLTQLPTERLAIFLAHTLKNVLRKPTGKSADVIESFLDEAGYVPYI